MGLVEIAYKVGNSNPANHNPRVNWSDGQPVAIKPPGIIIHADDYDKWLKDDSKVPPGFNETLKPCCRDDHIYTMRAVRAALDDDLSEIRAAMPDKPEHELRDLVRGYLDVLDSIHRDGFFDTAWGSAMVLAHFGIMIADLSHGEVVELTTPPRDFGIHPFHPAQARRKGSGYRLKYEQVLSDDSTVKVRDRNLVIVPPRGESGVIPFTWEQLIEPYADHDH